MTEKMAAQPAFLPGLQLSAAFYHEAVEPILRRHFPDLPHAAARIGTGSDVLYLDDQRSTDHFWGPLLHLLLRDEDFDRWAQPINRTLADGLPFEVRGFPTHFRPFEGAEAGLGHLGYLQPSTTRPINHGVMITTVRRLFLGYLQVDPLKPLAPLDWLAVSEQYLLMLTAGAVHHDGVGELSRARAALAYYPHDVWLYLLSAQWARIGQQEAFPGRAGEVGDDLSSRLIAAQLAQDVMRLAFLLERAYAPYSKWFGSAFRGLRCAEQLQTHLAGTLSAPDWRSREQHLARPYEVVAGLHNALGVTESVAGVNANYAWAAVPRDPRRPLRRLRRSCWPADQQPQRNPEHGQPCEQHEQVA